MKWSHVFKLIVVETFLLPTGCAMSRKNIDSEVVIVTNLERISSLVGKRVRITGEVRATKGYVFLKCGSYGMPVREREDFPGNYLGKTVTLTGVVIALPPDPDPDASDRAAIALDLPWDGARRSTEYQMDCYTIDVQPQ